MSEARMVRLCAPLSADELVGNGDLTADGLRPTGLCLPAELPPVGKSFVAHLRRAWSPMSAGRLAGRSLDSHVAAAPQSVAVRAGSARTWTRREVTR
jgi:hypothetical protein